MVPVTVAQIATWARGQVVRGDEARVLTGVSTDTRRLKQGDLFIALKGERFDGHDFLAGAAERGAGALVIETHRDTLCDRLPSPSPPVVEVADTTAALAHIARGYRGLFTVPVIAVTGSNGKTSTKDMIATVLGQVWPVLATEKNYNNHIGLPQTLLQIEPRHGAAVVELGMSNLGEIAALAQAAQPTIGVVTNVGPVHLETLGSIDRVADAKAELVEALSGDGLAVLNGDDERVRAMAHRTSANVLTYGLSEGVDVQAVDVVSRGLDGSRFTLKFRGTEIPIRLNAPGRHLVYNACAAAAVALSLGTDPTVVTEGLAAFRMGEMRLDVSHLVSGITLINDAYNSSPLSVRGALDVLSQTKAQRRVAVLGDMLELGDLTESAHRQIGADAVNCGVEWLIAVGQQRGLIAAGARSQGLDSERIAEAKDAAEAERIVLQGVRPNDLILIKGSRGVGLERVALALAASYPVADPQANVKETREP